ncbi:hypothetical protein [Cytobacillus firmus]|uniref:hypothetical protein n=1 Tax=Cytobacillus firmus TaxID=1399 RepID=UPI0021621072|nr:hypothetical protein [Cytobacillus firmus]
MKNAEREASFSEQKVLHPVHLLIACLEEKTGALGEISLKINLNKLSLSNLAGNINGKTQSEFFSMTVTKEVVQMFETALIYMKRYNQINLNEGHLLKALLTDSSIKHHLSEEDKNTILTLGTTSRDMIAHLGRYTFPRINFQTIRKAKKYDETCWETLLRSISPRNGLIPFAADSRKRSLPFILRLIKMMK